VVGPADPPAGAWAELTPLTGDAAPRIWSLVAEPRAAVAEPPPWPELVAEVTADTRLPRGPAMVCTGAPDGAVGCRRVYLHRPDGAISRGPAPEDLAVELEFGAGVSVVGRYRLDGLPVEGARISVVPADLESGRAFSLPLTAEGTKLRRTTTTDADGRFRTPPLRPGRYHLETRLPTGAVHRPDPFELPDAADLEAATGPRADQELIVWDLGELDAADELAVEVIVLDGDGQPLPDARVDARQGTTRRDLRSFNGRADAEGWVRLSGFTVELPTRVDCGLDGYRDWGADFELLPVEVICRLEELAVVTGRVIDVNGEAALGAISAVPRPVDGVEEPSPPGTAATGVSSAPDADGFFRLELPPGEHHFTAAAPGLVVDRRVLRLGAGERLDLGDIPLQAGREFEGRVVEAPPKADGPPPLVARERRPVAVAGAEIRAVDPPGAARATSDAEGLFTLAAIGDVPLHLEVRAEGFAAHRLELDREAQRRDDPLEIMLERGGWIRALVDGADGPCAGCRLRLEPGGLTLRTDADGEVVTDALRPGRYRVERPRVLHLGSQVLEIPATLTRHARVVADEITTVRFELEPERWPVRFDPHPGPGWWLIARTSRGEERLEPSDDLFHIPRPRGEPHHLFLTRFDPETDAEVEVRVAVVDGGRRPPETTSGLDPLTLELPDGHVEGRVSGTGGFGSADGRLAGVRVRLQTVADGAHVAELRTGDDGRFHLPHVPPGVYSVVLGERAFQFISVAPGESLDLGDFQLADGGY
ncbi:MAG: carboxypeptidase-like regulatory domain-containing protein, partial [Acidobacteriota bacterium]